MWKLIKKYCGLFGQSGYVSRPLPPKPVPPPHNVFFAGNVIPSFYDPNPCFRHGEFLATKQGKYRIKSVLRDVIKKRVILRVEEVDNES